MVMRTRKPAFKVYGALWLSSIANVVFASPGQRITRFMSSNWTSSASIQKSSTLTSRSAAGDSTIIIISSVLGCTILVLISLFLLLFPIWRRRHPRPPAMPATRTPSRLSKSSPSPSPSPLPPLDLTVWPVTPSPRRLAIDASAPTMLTMMTPTASRWDLEKASVHTPLGHPATAFQGNMFGTTENGSGSGSSVRHSQGRQPEPGPEPEPELKSSISSTFAAEMSSLLESISLKSSYSSLRSGGLGVPPRMRSRVPLAGDTERERQESCATTAGGDEGLDV